MKHVFITIYLKKTYVFWSLTNIKVLKFKKLSFVAFYRCGISILSAWKKRGQRPENTVWT
jgi:hypothetical protein